MDPVSGNETLERLQIRIIGVVQGVGFRPFVYRLATELGLKGWVLNDGNGVTLEVVGPQEVLLVFLSRLQKEKPAPAFLYALDHRFLAPVSYPDFRILESDSSGSRLAWILPDLATCNDCRRELLDPADRRYRYPFINCTNCGTRFTIIENLPYDRPLTSMKWFAMCELCKREYEDPSNRRFHAQPNACPLCGPQLEFRSVDNNLVAQKDDALRLAEDWLRQGRIVAIKGLGGYHLVADAANEQAAAELRKRKRRQKKPFAVMYPDLDFLRKHVHIPEFAESFLTSTQTPILLLPRTSAGYEEIAPSTAPDSPYLGVFLPYTPLHILLLHDLKIPLIATSGNLTDEPIQFDDEQARDRLSSLCDAFLNHDRPIVRHADDSVIQIVSKPRYKPQILRRARGYTPLPVLSPQNLPPLLALGGHQNTTFALSRRREIILSQHLGDMDGYEAREVFRKTVEDFLRLYEIHPVAVVHDLHPDYFTTHLARELGLPTFSVQHHHAHMAACMLENQLQNPVLAFTWDGTGYGPDKTVWGGECLVGTPEKFYRMASLQPFRLPAGEKSIKEPWRTALSLLWECYGEEIPRDLPLFRVIPPEKIILTLQILQKGIHSPITTSMGRLFDGVSALLGLSYYNTHQAEGAQLLEYAAWRACSSQTIPLPLPVEKKDLLRLDWRILVKHLVEEFRGGKEIEDLAAGFHQALAEAAVVVAQKAALPDIVMAGGVFCNRYLTEGLIQRLEEEGFHAFFHSQLPPTDGSLSAGQIWVAANRQVMVHSTTESRGNLTTDW